jgi:hypothetical protein
MEMDCIALFRPKFPFKGTRSGKEASDWLATEFPTKDKARMKLNEFNT